MTDEHTNPFFEEWTGPLGAPPFGRIRAEHFRPAFARALDDHKDEIERIAHNKETPDFHNTIGALERSGRLLRRVESVFFNLASSHTNEALQAIEREMAPVLAAHWNDIYLNGALFGRIDAVFARRAELPLDGQETRVLERYHLDFVLAGALLPAEEKKAFAAISERLAGLGVAFGQNVLADEQDYVLALEEDDLAGLPASVRQAAAETARDRGLDARYAVTTSRSSVEPVLQFAERRQLREKLFRAWTARGANANVHNNEALVAETVRLRLRQAQLLGYRSYADFKLSDTMAKTPEAARDLLAQVWAPARRRALEERDALQKFVAESGGNFALAAWDWRFYAEKLRKARYDFDESEIRPYLQLPNMIAAAFHTAQRLFGLEFVERNDVAVFHPDMRVWEVRRDGETLGLFYGDYFARPSKRGGAWMSAFREQENLDGPVLPLIVNTCNFPKTDPALLSFDEARTLFHEFGHALHGLLSKVRFPRLAGTNVARDFVELPSQIFEHWLKVPEILARFAVHHETGEQMPKALIDKLVSARNFNQGFHTVEFLASAFVDLDFHSLTQDEEIDALRFEHNALARIGMPAEIAMRHASPHFLHVFAGDGYAAGYYSYLWSEVLDADGFEAFEETGNAFDAAVAERLYSFVYSAGGSRDFAEAYRLFRGRDPRIDALLEGRGLKAA